MFKKVIILIMAWLLNTAVNAQTWIGFGSKAEGTPPETSIIRSDNQTVSFTVTVPGVYSTAKTESDQTYQRLLLPECSVTGETGASEIPVVTKMVANPTKGSTTIVYDVIEEGSVELHVYNQSGQLLQALPHGTKKPGIYHTEVSMAGIPADMYYYMLFVKGEKADAKKMVAR